MKIVILGSGPTALGACYRLADLIKSGEIKEEDVEITVIEKEPIPGGLARSITDDNGFVWDLGVHATFSHYKYYDDMLDWAVKDWNYIVRNAKLDMSFLWDKTDLHLLPYPIQYSIALFPDKEKDQSMKELKELHANRATEEAKPTTYDEWALKSFGETLTNVFFRPYNKKLWTVPIDQMNCVWVGDRVATIDLAMMEKMCAMDKSELESVDYGWGPNAKFRFPAHGGAGGLWLEVHKKLPQEWFNFNHTVSSIDADAKIISIDAPGDAKKLIKYDKLISTLPIDLLTTKYTGLLDSLNVVNNRVIVLGFGLKLPSPGFVKDKSWLYFPGEDLPFYRVTLLSNYSEHVTPDPAKYWSILCEIGRSRAEDGTWTEEELIEASTEAIIRKGFTKKEDIVSVFSIALPYGYPVPTVERDAELVRAHDILHQKDIYSRGRFGGWKYEVANQDHSFMQGKEIVDKILFNKKETVYTI